MFKGWWLFAIGVLFLMAAVTRVLYRYADFRRIGWWPVLIIWVGWVLNFGIVLLVPLDIANAKHERCINQVRANWNTTHIYNGETLLEEIQEECGGGPWIEIQGDGLALFWKLIYWITYVLCWTAFPITQSFCMTGEFYFFERLRAAIRTNFMFYAIYGAIGIVGLFVLILTGANLKQFNSLEAVRNVAVAASNAYGMFLMVAFLGYSLVENPAYYWRHSNDKRMLNYYYWLAVSYREKYEKCKTALDKVLKQLKMFDEKIQHDDPFRPLVEVVLTQTPPEYRDIFLGEGNIQPTYDNLCTIHHDLKGCLHETLAARSLYVNLMYRSFHLEDIIESKTSPKKIIEWEFKPKREGRFAGLTNRLEWIWFCYLHQWVFLGICFVLTCMGLIIVWSEEVMSFTEKLGIKVELGIFAQMLKNEHDSYPFEIQWLFVFVPLAYIAACCYSSLFKINFFGIYRLIPHHQSDAPSLLFNSMYIARLTFPIAYNFMLMSKTVPMNRSERCAKGVYETADGQVCALNTEFSTLYARPILAMPDWIQNMNLFFPIVLLVLCVLTFFDVYSKFVLNCCLKSVRKWLGVYDDRVSGDQIQQGKELVGLERGRRRNGEAWTIDSVGLQQTSHFNLSEGNSNSPKQPFSIKGVFDKFKTPPAVKVELSNIKEKIMPKVSHKSGNSKVDSIRAKYSKLENVDGV